MVEVTRMSSKGQVVIPQKVREKVDADEGTIFAVAGGKDTIVLKKMASPSNEELLHDLELIAGAGRKRLEALGFGEEDIPEVVAKRREKRAANRA